MYTDQLAIQRSGIYNLSTIGKQALGCPSKSISRLKLCVCLLMCSISDFFLHFLLVLHLKLQYFPNRTCGPLPIDVSYGRICGLCSTEYSCAQLFSSSAVFLFVSRSLQPIFATDLVPHQIFFMRKILMYLDKFTQLINTIK